MPTLDESTDNGRPRRLPESLESKLVTALIANGVEDRKVQREDMAALRSSVNRNGLIQGANAAMLFVITLVALYGGYALRGVDEKAHADAVVVTAPLAQPTVTTSTTETTTAPAPKAGE